MQRGRIFFCTSLRDVGTGYAGAATRGGYGSADVDRCVVWACYVARGGDTWGEVRRDAGLSARCPARCFARATRCLARSGRGGAHSVTYLPNVYTGFYPYNTHNRIYPPSHPLPRTRPRGFPLSYPLPLRRIFSPILHATYPSYPLPVCPGQSMHGSIIKKIYI